MTIQETSTASGAEHVVWDLSDLYLSTDDPQIDVDIKYAIERANAFREAYLGKIAELTAFDLLQVVQEYEAILEQVQKPAVFASLGWAADTNDSNWSRLVSRTEQVQADVGQILVFFMLEWVAVEEDRVQDILSEAVIAPYRHYLQVMRLSQNHVLSEAEERITSELALSGINGWRRYFGEVMSAARYEYEGKQLTMSEILELVRASDRGVRQNATDAFTIGLENTLHTSTFVFNMMARYRQSMDKLRGYPNWVRHRNIANQSDDRIVSLLVESVTSRYDIVQRHYRLMRKLLGYDELYDYDRYAPYGNSESKVQWPDAKDIVLSAFDRFHPRMADIAGKFFADGWIHAALGSHKRSGAFSHSAIASAHPYILMNYVGSLNNVMTLAHELGHGIHQYLSRGVGNLQQSTPLTTAEMASTFAEMLVFDSLMNQIEDPQERLALRLDKIGDTFATVFRQIAMNRFEDALHTTVRDSGELTTAEISELWMNTQRPMFGDSLTLRDAYSTWWSYIPHFISVPGYVYAYSFGELLVWSIYAEYQTSGDGFADRYIEALAKGGSVWPADLVAPLGVDLHDEKFWHKGLDLIEQMVMDAENDAEGLQS